MGTPDVAESYPGQHSALDAEPSQFSAIPSREEFQFNCLRNARYHEERERFFLRLRRFGSFFVVLLGSASFTSILVTVPRFTSFVTPEGVGLIASLIVTLAALFDLVFDLSGMANRHSTLKRSAYDLLAQSLDESRPIERLQEQLIRNYADEPPTMHAVSAMAYNEAMAAFGHPPHLQFKIGKWHRRLRNYFSFASATFETYEELGEQGPTPFLFKAFPKE